MVLTTREREERNHLMWLQRGMVFMTTEQRARLQELRLKEFHNTCSNSHCTGYFGEEHETTCPKCERPLLKLLS